MPRYEYECAECGHKDEEFQRMADQELVVCPACESPSYHKQISQFQTDLKEFHTPIDMFSIAMDTDEEIREFARKAPDVEISIDQNSEAYGIPIVRCRKQKLAALKAVGYVENN